MKQLLPNQGGVLMEENQDHRKTYQQVKRETLTAEEIGRLPNEECLVFLRGERPARDKKFKYETHKNYKLDRRCLFGQ